MYLYFSPCGRGGAGKPLKCHFICLLCILHLYFHLYLSQFLNLYLYLQLYIFYVTRAEVTQTSLHPFALYLHFHLYLSLFLFIFVFAIVHILCDKSGKPLKHHYICSSVCFVFSFSYASLLVSMFVILFACICISVHVTVATQMSLYMFVSLFCIFIGLSYFVICICMFICICISVHVILCDFMWFYDCICMCICICPCDRCQEATQMSLYLFVCLLFARSCPFLFSSLKEQHCRLILGVFRHTWKSLRCVVLQFVWFFDAFFLWKNSITDGGITATHSKSKSWLDWILRKLFLAGHFVVPINPLHIPSHLLAIIQVHFDKLFSERLQINTYKSNNPTLLREEQYRLS